MDDTLACPICKNKLRTVKLTNRYLPNSPYMAKPGNYFERTCTGVNHSLQLFTNEETQQIDMLKFSLNPKYTLFLEINYVSQKSRISCLKKGEISYIAIPKMLTPDFPDLVNIKDKISMYVTFS